MVRKIFITGVDTDIGKTFVSKGLCIAAVNEGKKTGYYKPFQSGAFKKNGKIMAPDVSEFFDCPQVEAKCSYLLEGEVSPYLALKLAGFEASVDKIKADVEEFCSDKDFVAVEGAGGLLCPVVEGKTYADIISELKMDILIVTTPDLGRLNHTLMTIKCANDYGIKIRGIIINKVPDVKTLSQEYFSQELRDFSDVEILSEIPLMENPSKDEIIKNFQALIMI